MSKRAATKAYAEYRKARLAAFQSAFDLTTEMMDDDDRDTLNHHLEPNAEWMAAWSAGIKFAEAKNRKR